MLKIVIMNSNGDLEIISSLIHDLLDEGDTCEISPDSDTIYDKDYISSFNFVIISSDQISDELLNLPAKTRSELTGNLLLFMYLLPENILKENKKQLFDSGADYILPLVPDKADLAAVFRNALKFIGFEKEKIELKARYDDFVRDKTFHLEREIEQKTQIDSQLKESLMKLEKSQRAALNLMEDLRLEVETRKNRESELRENERVLNTLISNLPGFVYRCSNDKDRTMSYLSDGCEEITGYKPEHLINNKFVSFNELIREDFREEIYENRQQLLDEKGYFEFKYPIITKSGVQKWVWERGKGIYSDDGNLLSLEGFITDITDKKAAEDALFESEEKFRSAFITNPDAVSITGFSDGRYIDVNNGFEALSGFKRDEIIGRTAFELNIWVDNDKRSQLMEELLKSGFCRSFETRFRIKSGKILDCSVSASLITIKGEKHLLAITRDITESRKILEAVAQSEEKFRISFMTSPDAITITRISDGKIIESNEGAHETFGYSKEEITAPGFSSIQLFSDIETRDELIRELTANGFIKNKRVELRHKTGRPINALASASLISINNETCILSVVRDISEYILAQEELDKSREQYRYFIEKSREGIYYTEYNPPVEISSPVHEQAKAIMQRGIIKSCNRAMVEMYGFSSETELTGKGISDLYVNTDTPEIIKSMEDFINARYQIDNLETMEYDKNGNIKYFLNNVVGILSGNKLIANWGVQRDITQQKMTEIALQESNTRLMTFIEAIPDAVFIKDGEGRWQIINNLASKLFKISNHDWYGKTELELAAERPEFAGLHITCSTSDEQAWENKDLTFSHEMIPDENGNKRFYEVRKLPLFKEGKRHMLIVIGRDITESRKAQTIKEIQYNIANAEVTADNLTELSDVVRNELSKLIDTTNFLIATYDHKTDELTSLFIADKHAKINKWPGKDSLSGLVVRSKKSMLLNKKEITELAEKGLIIQRGGRAESWLGVPIKSENKVIGIIVVQSYENPNVFGEDEISLLEQIANQLSVYFGKKKAEEDTNRLLKAIEQSPVSIVITDAAGNIEYVNKFFCSISGFSEREVLGKNPRLLNSGYMSKEFYKEMWDVISSGKTWRGEILNKKKNGRLFWENSVIAPVHNEHKKITHYVAVKEDVTDKKKMIEELVNAKEKAEEMNKVKSNFFSNMSHELRTPLIGILGFSEILEEELVNDEKLLKMVHTINKAGLRLLETLNLILNLSKFEAGKIETRFDKVNLIDPVKETFELYISAAQKKALKYTFTAPDEEIICHLDRNLLQNVLSNLINNAVKFTKEGSISVIIEKSDNEAIVTVKDTGIGIPEDKIDMIWKEFRQASEGFSRSFEGTGLGLTIAKKFTELMSGSIDVESIPGEGTSFILTFPLLGKIAVPRQSSDKKTAEESLPGFLLRKYDILYVEDDSVAVDVVKQMLRNYCNIYNAISLEDALIKAGDNDYDLVLMDINLRKGPDGTEITKKLRELTNLKDTPVIAITAYAMDGDKEDFLAKGLNGYISKPFTKKQLIGLIGEFLDLNAQDRRH